MYVDRMVEAAVTQFKQKLTDFCRGMDLSKLTPEVAEQVCSGLKASLADAGVAGYRAFLQAHEVWTDVVVAQGEVFRFNGEREKCFLTPFGDMVLPRRCYQNKSDTKSHVPLDAAWGMEGHYMAPQVREAVLFSCAHVTPTETAQLLKRCALFSPHATAITHVVEKTGELMKTHRDAVDKAVRAQETAPEGTHALVVSMDGATVLLDEKGKRFGRPAERPRGDAPKDTPTAYRVAMVGSVTHYGAPQAPGETPQRLQSRYVAHMPEERCPTFKTQFEAELDDAETQAPSHAVRIVLLDGARELWSYVDQQPRYEGYHKLIDYWHAVEHISMAAEALFGKGSAEGNAWYEKYRKRLCDSDLGPRQLLRSMDYYAQHNALSKNQRQALSTQRTYFERNKHRMTYATFRSHGWPIGSGPIEAACKTLIKTRLCRSGMRWSRCGGQRILALRTYVKSNRWDRAWQHIKELKQAA